MGLNELKNLIYHKAKISPVKTAETNIADSVIAEVIDDFCKRFPWTFLSVIDDDSISLSAGDYQKALPRDFLHLKGVRLKDSDNVIHKVFSEEEFGAYEHSSDLDDTGQPYLRWVYYDNERKPYLQFHPKSDVAYTVLLRYLQKLNPDDVGRIPSGLVIFFGCMQVLAPPAEMGKYETLYENGILRAWASDRPDTEEDLDWGTDPMTEAYNAFTAGI